MVKKIITRLAQKVLTGPIHKKSLRQNIHIIGNVALLVCNSKTVRHPVAIIRDKVLMLLCVCLMGEVQNFQNPELLKFKS